MFDLSLLQNNEFMYRKSNKNYRKTLTYIYITYTLYKAYIISYIMGDRLNQNRRSIVVQDKMWFRLKNLAGEEGRSMSELIREALVDLFHKKTRSISQGYDPVKDQL